MQEFKFLETIENVQKLLPFSLFTSLQRRTMQASFMVLMFAQCWAKHKVQNLIILDYYSNSSNFSSPKVSEI